MAFLGKQAWRLVQFPNSLVARIFKVKYYPRQSFLEAHLAGNFSFIWHSILEAQDVIKKKKKQQQQH